MTPEQLKASILQYAIQGKLVEQRAEEGTAEELYQQIQEEKQKLIKEGKIKKEKPLAEITEDEAPFDIPESWKWCYIGDVFSHTAGKALNAKNTVGKKYKYITTSNVYWDHFELDSLKEMFYTDEEIEKYSVKYGDLLVLEGGDVGRTAIWNLNESYCIQNHIHRLRPYVDTDIKYFYYVMMFLKYKGNIAGKGIGIQGLSANALHSIKVPLPPLEEQKRIVAKIEELLPLVDRYAEAYEKLEKFNAKFLEDMKKSILQYAIMGKLVEQREEEGTAEDLYSQIVDDREKRIKAKQIRRDKRSNMDDMPDEMPFDIPNNWKWVTLGSILLKLTDGTHKTPKYTESGVKFVSVKDMSSGTLSLHNTKFISEEEHNELFSRCDPQKGDMLLSKVGTTGVPAIVDTDEPFSLFVSVALLKYNHMLINEKFLYYLLQSPLVQNQASDNTRGVGNKNWVLDAIGSTLIVLPPFEEQKRIVAKIEELMPYCEQLKK